ncbi:hypothetical protein Q6348_15465 [Isoptericola sp. b441]|uniref:LysM domain-containing protein n=1 Tax=Actinotalea lenta TaxID=3064654 RepID=A0ABT9DF52_9CELL|nr:hypothetical protein [Isoptericola sp. b441]MDO8108596.1 hypothetical protein [Isoptericola sp. b441]
MTRAVAAWALALAAATALTRALVNAAPRTATIDERVATAVLGLGTAAALVLAVGMTAVLLGAVSGAVGRRWVAVERVGARLTPRGLRRVLVVGISLGLSGLSAPALAETPPDLGWQITAQAPDLVDQPLGRRASSPTAASASAEGPTAHGVPTAHPVPAPHTSTTPEPQASGRPAHPVSATRPTPAGAATTRSATQAAERARVTVRRGDCLWSIAASHLPPGASDAEVAAAWPAWYAANRATIGPDPGLLLPGQVLVQPVGEPA